MLTPTITGSNSLADLAARIRQEHEATATALRDSVTHAMAAGDLLIEAKAQLKHGQWLPWLKSCGIAERTAQRYIRLAKNRATIEAKSDTVSDLGIRNALALLSSNDEIETFTCRELREVLDELVELVTADGFVADRDLYETTKVLHDTGCLFAAACRSASPGEADDDPDVNTHLGHMWVLAKAMRSSIGP